MAAHTPAPWPSRMITRDAEGTEFVSITLADYARAGACVAACEGIPDQVVASLNIAETLRQGDEAANLRAEVDRLKAQIERKLKEHREEVRDLMREARDAAAEARWEARQGDEYGSY